MAPRFREIDGGADYVRPRHVILDVEEVAAGHLLAAERVRVGQRYILGEENLTLKQSSTCSPKFPEGPRCGAAFHTGWRSAGPA